MKRHLLIATGMVVTLVAFSQTDSGGRWLTSTCHTIMGGTNYTCRITREAVIGGPEWDPSKPLPLSFAQAERVARAELEKLTTEVGAWEVTTFELIRARGSANWYYHVEMYPVNKRWPDRRCFNIYMTAEGKPGAFYEER